MIRTLKNLRNPIRVGLVGAGCMGSGIAHQISITPGMSLEWIVSRRLERAQNLAGRTGTAAGDDACQLLRDHPVDVLVEASDSIWAAYQYCRTALENGAHVVLMNAEVDLVFGPLLCKVAAENGRIFTSDAGDQHGVLARMIEEIQLWGFDIIQAGNVKGFLSRHATGDELVEEAAKRNLALRKCCAFTDGTKLNIEMAVLANGFGFRPLRVGMSGPAIDRVDDVLEAFDPDQLVNDGGMVDYILGAQPGGGVYVIARSDDPIQQPYLNYYKVGNGPYYLFKRDYHLCHLETTTAIAGMLLRGEPVLQPWAGRVTEVYAFAKSNWEEGTMIPHGIGGDHFYGMIARFDEGCEKGWVPIALLDGDGESGPPELGRAITVDEPLTWDHLPSFSSPMIDLYRGPDNHSAAE